MTPADSGPQIDPSQVKSPELARPTARRWPRWIPAVAAGLAGAVTVTLLNEGVRQVIRHAPRMDIIGERALVRVVRAAGGRPPQGRTLYRATMAADLVSNALYYSLVAAGSPRRTWQRGSALGLAAGLGAVFLPRPLGLGRQPEESRPLTQVLTALWYLTAGLSAAAVCRTLQPQQMSQAGQAQ